MYTIFRFSSKKQSADDPASFSRTLTNDRLRKLDNMPLYYWLFTKTTGKKVVFKASALENKTIRRIRLASVPVGLLLLIGGPYYFWSFAPTTNSEIAAGFLCVVIAIFLLGFAAVTYQRSKIRVPVNIEEPESSPKSF